MLGITDTKTLIQAEAEISAEAIAELIFEPVGPTYDLAHLQAIHQYIFSDVYSWAGEIRKTEFSKGGLLFMPWKTIRHESTLRFEALRRDLLQTGSDKSQFGRTAGYHLGRINTIHPFREGNGRAQRILLDQIAERAGFVFEWVAISGDAMDQASFVVCWS